MGADFGGVRLASRRLGFWIAGAVAVALAVAGFAINASYHQTKDVAKAADWAIAGPPCPELTPAAYQAQPYRPRKLFDYDGVVFGRAVGHAECDEVRGQGGRSAVIPVCQFTSPALLVVTMQGARTVFKPAPGAPATIYVQDGRPHCVLAGNFRIQ